MNKESTVTPPLDNQVVAGQIRRAVEALGSQINRKLETLGREVYATRRAEMPHVLIVDKAPLPSASSAGVAFVISEKKWYYSDGTNWSTVPVGSGSGGGGLPGQHGITDETYHTHSGIPWDLVGVDSTNNLAMLHSSSDPIDSKYLRSDADGRLGLQRLTTSELYGRNALGEENITLQPFGVGRLVLIPQLNRIGTEAARYSATSIPKAGWSIHTRYAGDLPTTMSEFIINRIIADELRVKIFVADETRVDRGILIIAKGYGILSRPFQVPNSPGDIADIYFENSPVVTGGLFTDGDWVLIELADFSGGGANLEWIWGQVWLPTPGVPASINVTPPDPLPPDYIAEQRWKFQLRLGTAGTDLKRGSFVLGFGAPGQGYIVLDAVSTSFVPTISVHVWGLNSDGSINPTATPYGASGDGSLDLSASTAKVVMGHLDPALDNTLNPQGWGFYGSNTYLKGILQTNNIRIDNKGAALYTPTADNYSEFDVFGFRKLGVTANPLYSYYQGYWSSTDVKARLHVSDTEGLRNSTLFLESFSTNTSQSIISLKADNTTLAGNGATVYLERSAARPGFVSITGDHAIDLLVESATGESATNRINMRGDFVPTIHDAFSLGSASKKFKAIHVGLLNADTIAGATMSGAEWEHTASMIIDANNAANTTLTITNQGGGVADVIMDRHLTLGAGGVLTASGISVTGNIALTGTVDGVDLSAHVLLPDVHHPKQHLITDATNHTASGLVFDLVGLDATNHLAMLRPMYDVTPAQAAILRTNPAGILGLQGLIVHEIYSRNTAGQENINLNPVTDGAVVLLDPRELRSTNYIGTSVSPIQGFSIHNRLAGTLTTNMSELAINRILADELRVKIFVADETRVDRGILYIAKGYGLLSRPFVTPRAINSSQLADLSPAYVYFEDSPVINGPLFSANDWVLIQIADFSGGAADLEWIWGQLTGYYDVPDPIPLPDDYIPEQRWLFTLRLGSLNRPIKNGSFTYNFGAPGQGYIVLNAVFGAHVPVIAVNVWGVNAAGAAVPGSTPYGGNVNGEVDTSNHKSMVVMGNLDPALDARLTPSGWGFFGQNAFLKGILQTENAILDEKGLAIYSTSKADFSDFEVFGFRKEGVTDNPLLAYFQGYWSGVDVKGRIRVSDTALVRNSTLFLESYSAAADDARVIMEAKAGSLGAGLNLTSIAATRGNADLWANHSINIRVTSAAGSSATNRINVQGDFVPTSNELFNLGSAAFKWNNVYAKNMVVDSITSGGTLTGATWSFPGSMLIDADSAATTTLTITNSGTGMVDVIMDRHLNIGGTLTAVTGSFSGNIAVGGNIGVAGTIDGVDLGAHAGDTNIHHNRDHDLVGSTHTHTANDLVTGYVLRATDANSFSFGTITSAVISNFIEAAQDAVGGIVLNTTTVSLAYDDVANKLSATVLPGGIDHGGLAGRTDDDHLQYVHNTIARTITAAHTFNPTVAGAPFVLGANAQSQLVTGLRADQLNKSVIAGNGVAGGGLLTANVTLSIVGGTLISVAADGVSLALGTAQYQVPVTGATPFTPAYTSLSAFAGNGLLFGTAFNITLASPSGLVVTADSLAIDDSIAGNGLAIAGKVLSIGGGALMAVAADGIGLANGTAQYQVITTGATPFAPAYTALSNFAGNGLAFSTGFDIVLASPSGLQVVTDALQIDDAIAGAGLAIAGKVLSVGGGTLLTVAADSVGITPGAAGQFIGTGAGTAAAWQDISLLAGAGLVSAGSTLAVGAGTLIAVAADTVGIAAAPGAYYLIGSGSDTVAEWFNMSYLAGDGLTYAAGVLSIRLDSPSGLQLALGKLAIDDEIAGAGLAIAGKILSINLDSPSGLQVVADKLAIADTIAGNGLAIANKILAINLAATSGLQIVTDALQIDDAIAGVGLTIAGKVLAVNPGTMLENTGDTVGVKTGAAYQFVGTGNTAVATWQNLSSLRGDGLAYNSGVFTVDSGTLITVDANGVGITDGAAHSFIGTGTGTAATWRSILSLAGNGLSINPGSLSELQIVAADTTITVASDSIRVNLGHAYTWTAAHQFSSTVLISGTLTTGNIYPAATDTYDIGSSLYLYSNAYFSQLNAVLYAENTAQLLGGWFIVPKYSGKMGAVATGQTAIDLGPNPGGIITNGDFLIVRAHNTSGAVHAEYMTIVSNAGGNIWNVTRDSNNDNTPDPTWADGTPYMLLGKSGDGRIELNAQSTPRISMVVQGATHNSGKEYLRIGDLNAGWDYLTQTWGFASGEYNVAGRTWITVDPTLGFRIGNNTTTIGQWDASGTIYVGAQAAEHIKISNSAIEFHNGSTVTGSMTNEAWVIGETNNSRTRISIDPIGGFKVIWKDEFGDETTPIWLTVDGDATFTGSVAAVSGTIGGWNIGANQLYSTNIGMVSGGIDEARIEVGGGDLMAGLAASDDADDIAIWAGSSHEFRASAPFRVTADGDLFALSGTFAGTVYASAGSFTGTVTAESGSFSGSITSTSGTIGGWVIGATTLSAGVIALNGPNLILTAGLANVGNIWAGTLVFGGTANGGGINVASTDPTDIVFFAGSDHANRALAEFQVTGDGKLKAESGTIGAYTFTAPITGENMFSSSFITLKSQTTNLGHIHVGTAGGLGGGINVTSVNSPDIVFYAGAKHADRASAPFRATLGGKIFGTEAVIGKYTFGPGTYGNPDFYSTTIFLTSEGDTLANIRVGNQTDWKGVGIAQALIDSDIVIWTGTNFASRSYSPFKVTNAGNLTAADAALTSATIGTLTTTGSFTAATINATTVTATGNITAASLFATATGSSATGAAIGWTTGAGLYKQGVRAVIKGDTASTWSMVAEGSQAKFNFGTAAAPGIAFETEATTGVWYSTDQVNITVNGSNRVGVSATGLNVVGALSASTTVTAGTGGFSAPGNGTSSTPSTYVPYAFTSGNLTGLFGDAKFVGFALEGVVPFITRSDGLTDSYLMLGRGITTTNRNAYVDFFTDILTPVNYTARILRSPGTNANLNIYNTGTGSIVFVANGATAMTISSAGVVAATSSMAATAIDVALGTQAAPSLTFAAGYGFYADATHVFVTTAGAAAAYFSNTNLFYSYGAVQAAANIVAATTIGAGTAITAGTTITATSTIISSSGTATLGGFSAVAGGAPATYTPFRFNNTHGTGLLGSPDAYVGLAVKDQWHLLTRSDGGGDSWLRLGYGIGGTTDRNAYIDFFCNTLAPTTRSAWINRIQGVNGGLQIVNYGAGSIIFYTEGVTALTIYNTQNATFAASVTAVGTVSAAVLSSSGVITAGTYIRTTAVGAAGDAAIGWVSGAGIYKSTTRAVLTGDTNWGILADNGQAKVQNGTALLPALAFEGDPNTGIFWNGTDNIGISTGGVAALQLNSTNLTMNGNVYIGGTFYAVNGSITVPTYGFTGDTNTGFYLQQADIACITTGGARRFAWTNTYNLTDVPLYHPNGTAAAPSITFTTEPGHGFYYQSATAWRWSVDGQDSGAFVKQGTCTQLGLVGNDNTATGIGSFLSVGNNTNATGPAAGFIMLSARTSTAYRIWPDGGGLVRIHTANPTFANDALGIVVGSQASNLASKDVLGEAVEGSLALEFIRIGAEGTRRFQYKVVPGEGPEARPYNGEEFSGIITDYAPRYGMDGGKALNTINAIGDLMIGTAHIATRVEQLEAEVAELKRRLEAQDVAR